VRVAATKANRVQVARVLLAAGAETALHEAIVLGNGDRDHVTVVRLLLDAGADPTIPDPGGKLPRQLAAEAGHTAIVAELDRQH
jgi:uncharacterized protein